MFQIIKTLILELALLLVVIGCSNNLSGGGTDTSNSFIVGTVINTDSIGIEGAVLKVIPVDYNPVKDSSIISIMEEKTFSGGHFEIAIENNGIYNLYVVNTLDSQSTLIKSININDKDTINLSTIEIKDPGAIKIVPSDYKTFLPHYFYIPGTEFYSTVDTIGNVYLLNVPSVESLSVYLNTLDNAEISIIDNISVISNDTVTTPLRVLMLVGGDTTITLTERIKKQRQLMIDSGAVVEVGDFNEFSTDNYDTSKIDLIYCAYNVNWKSLKADEFVSLPINIASVSGEGYAKLGMIFDSAGITYGTATEYNIMTGVNAFHPVLEGTGTSSSATTHAFDGGSASWGKTENTNTAGILIGVADQKRKYVFAYQKGASMDVGIAPAARIALFSGDVDLGDDRGKMILWRTLLWGCGKL